MTAIDYGATASAPEAARSISKAEERQIARDLSPPVAWPTLGLTVLLPVAFAALVFAGFQEVLPLWACTMLIALVAYGHFTLLHEAIHGNVVSSPKSLLWVNSLVGWIGAVGVGLGWPALRRGHLLHHSHTNTDRDPDIFAKGTFVQLLGKWAMSVPFSLVPMTVMSRIGRSNSRYAALRSEMSAWEMHGASLPGYLTLGLLGAALLTGHFTEWLLLWFIPQRLAFLILQIFFQWLPHYPFDRDDRYGNTRISLWMFGTALTFQQNLHLMHHLWPGVPFYNYGRLFVALRPVLEAEGARIEGLGVGPLARPVPPLGSKVERKRTP
jgi:beta-carotene hydroxylase